MGKIPRQGEYLTSSDIQNGDVVTIIEEPQLRSAEETGFDRDVWGIKVELPNKTEKLWTLNKTTYNELWDSFGDESKNWLGKKVSISTENRKVRGEKKTIMFGEPVAEPAATPVATPANQPALNLTPEEQAYIADMRKQKKPVASATT